MSALELARSPGTSSTLLAMVVSLVVIGCDATKTSSAAEDPPKERGNGAPPARSRLRRRNDRRE